jgi:hypothetical protein
MKANPKFANRPKSFWACVRSLSQHIGYSKGNSILVPSVEAMAIAFDELGLSPEKMMSGGQPTALGKDLVDYFAYRAKILVEYVQPRLMTAEQAKNLFNETKAKLSPRCPVPMNKQKGDKKAEAFLTGLVNMVVEANIGDIECDYDPRELTTITHDGLPVRTLARRVDGAFPSPINPIAVWEVKEYYYTTTFGSRVADGVYESLLDGLELEELRENEGIDVKHYLMIDAHYTWWTCGKSYLCRMIDMIHMGYVDEVLFGREVVERLPNIAAEWAKSAIQQGKGGNAKAELPG